MPQSMPFVREAGTGPGVVCLQCNASSSSQWRELLETLAPRFHVLAPDSYGSGKSADWSSDRVISLQDEAAFIEPVLAAAGEPFFLVGHSYGAAVALRVALGNPGRVRGLVLYEGDPTQAARHFIDYWMGPSSWDKTPPPRQAPVAASVVNVRR